MFITDSFVFIHIPKTGGTFVTTVLEKVYKEEAPRANTWPSPIKGGVNRFRALRGAHFCEIRKHDGCEAIPRRDRKKEILAVVRQPHDWWVSRYEFGWWKDHPELFGFGSDLYKRSASFPELTFPDFLSLALPNANWSHLSPRNSQEGRDTHPTVSSGDTEPVKIPHFDGFGSAGALTRNFFRYFAFEPQKTLDAWSSGTLTVEALRSLIYPVHFLRTDRLNEDLYHYLEAKRIPVDKIAFIRNAGKIQPPRARRDQTRSWQSYYNRETFDFVRRQEDLLFRLFPEFDVPFTSESRPIE
jgi:hypothetical protein